MGRIGLVFPGQGSQFVGMGGDLCERHETFRNVFARAREILDTDILSLCLNGPREALDQTVNTQLAVLTFEIAAFETLKELNVVTPSVVAGHSLGEYSAIYASGALGLEEVLTLVRSRAKRHEEAVPQGFGAMAAIIGLTLDQMKELVMECSREEEPVDLANINAPNQAVVSGHSSAVQRLMERAKEIGAKLVVRLPISAPCHCRLLAEASGLFRKDLEKARFRSFERPVIPNCEPAVFYSRENAAELLSKADRLACPLAGNGGEDGPDGCRDHRGSGTQAGPLRPHQEHPEGHASRIRGRRRVARQMRGAPARCMTAATK